jgi:hypothetical protein
MPAFVKEAADRAVRYALASSQGDTEGYTITTEDLVHAATGLRSQFDRMQDAPEQSEKELLADGFASIVKKASRDVVTELAAPNDELDENVGIWNQQAIQEVRQLEAVNGKR